MKKCVHQLLAGFNRADAISNEALLLREVFRKWGFRSDIFCERKTTHPQLRNEALDLAAFPEPGVGDVAFLHLSAGSPANELFARLPCRKALLYHNVTPPGFFAHINKQTAIALEKGRNQVAALADATDVNLADSQFNAEELGSVGYSNVEVFPLLLDLSRIEGDFDRRMARAHDDGVTNILFVGRCAPNKAIGDLLKAFAFFQRHVEPNSRLIHVGSWTGTERYYHLLQRQVTDLELRDVIFTGSVSQPVLNAFYRSAHVFLCLSEHEGFCIPVVESMVMDVPVLAYAAGAVPDTLDGAGVLLRRKEYDAIAEMMGMLVHDTAFRDAVIAGQRARVARYRQRNLEEELRTHLDPILCHPEASA